MIRKNIIKELRVAGCIIGVLVALLIVFAFIIAACYSQVEQIEMVLSPKPGEILSFYGLTITGQLPPVFEAYSMVVIFLNILAGAVVIYITVANWNTEKDNGTQKFICGQYMTRIRFFITKAITAISITLIVWLIYIGGCYAGVGILSKKTNTSAREVYDLMLAMCGRGIAVMLLLTSVGVFYACFSRKMASPEGFSLLIISVTMACGNLYKIPAVIAYYQRAGLMKDDIMMMAYRVLCEFRNFSPLSWLNIFSINKELLNSNMIIVYAVTGVLLFVAAAWVNERRDIAE